MANRKYDEATKQKALAVAEATSQAEAARQTGIPKGTIAAWAAQAKRAQAKQAKQAPKNHDPDPEGMARAESITRALAKAEEYIEEAQKARANRLLMIMDKAVDHVEKLIQDTTPEDMDANRAAWLRSVVGVVAQFAEKAQLLAGQPTAHQKQSGQVTNRHEHIYDITQRIEQYSDVFRDVAARSRRGNSEGDTSGNRIAKSLDST
ncbi:MAG: hypothetical protein AB7E55_01270 [Pigmentiphaga sp.]